MTLYLILYLIVQSPALLHLLLHLPRTLKLFEIYIFTELKAMTMNKVCSEPEHCKLGGYCETLAAIFLAT